MHRLLMRVHLSSVALCILCFVSLAPLTNGGTAEAPEVTDISFDVTTSDGTPACVASGLPAPAPAGQCLAPAGFANLVSGWVATETETAIVLHINSADNANVYGPGLYEFRFTVGATDYIAGFLVQASELPSGGGEVTPTGVATAAEFVETVMVITVPRAAIGSPAVGAAMSKLFLTSSVETDIETFIDRAPDGTAFGTDYTFALGGAAPAGNGTTPGQNSTAPPTNTTASPTSGPTTTAPTSSSSSTSTSVSQSASTTSTPTTATTSGSTSGSAVDKITGEKQGYTIASAAGAGVVLLLSLLGRFGRWG